jgi:transcriptional regulator with XRE-family HTH domain
MNFSRRFKRLRESRGWTQEDAAERLGVSRPTIAGYESEEKNRIPRQETLHKIAKLFNVSIDYLLSGSDKPMINDQAKSAVMEAYDRLPLEKKKLIDDMIKALNEE